MSDNSDASVSPIIHKGKRKPPVLTDSDVESDSSISDKDVPVLRRSGKRKNRIRDSDSDSSIEKPRKLKRVPRVTSDAETCSSNESDIVKIKKPARVVSDDSNNSDSDTDASGASDNGFEDNTSDEWESDWISESEANQSQILTNNDKNNSIEPAASTSLNLGNISDSSDGESEKCPICLLSFNTQEVGTPETCDHSFCADCIQEWSKNVNTCPVDRQTFTLILVRKRYNGKVIRTVPVDVRRPSVDELIQEDPTFCEICGMSDREDRLLLCDGCDLGYHLECLDPPMETVPIEEWFCSNCRRDESVNQQPQRGNRGERLLPRTMQSERIRATIETNRNNLAINIDQQSLSSGFEDTAMPGPSRTSSVRNRSRNLTSTRKHIQKRSRRSYKKKRVRYSITYEICEITGEKIAIKTKRKYRRTKKRTKQKIKRSTRRVVKPKTVKKRLAYQLGMCPPKKVGLAVPEVKVKGNTNNIGNIGYQRSQAGIPTLHLFGQRDQLDYFSDSDNDAAVSGGGEIGILTHIRVSSSNMGAMRRAARRKAAVLSPVPPISVNSIDILSSILDSQEKLHSKNSVISVSRDGTLRIEQSERSRKSEKNNNDLVKPKADYISENSPLDISSNGELETTQAPMFPGRGGGGNRQPYGFHNRGGYRGGDTNRYEGGSGGNYNHFQGGGPRGRGGGYGQNMYNQRDNFGGGYMNYHHHCGPPPPFRGRGGPRFPMRRPQLHQQQPQEEINQPEVPVELNLDEPMEQSVTDDQSQQQEEDVDIYSDIETGTPVLDDEVSQTKPVSEPEATLVSQAYNNSGSDDDSGSELVIDDTVKETDKYDPTQPSADTDSNNSEPPETLNETEQPRENIETVNINSEKIEEQEKQNENFDVQLQTETPKITSFSPEIVNEAVQQVIQEHLSTPTKSVVMNNEDDDDDDDDVLDDEDCPNFSIYSSTSIDIAKSTEISVYIPKQNDIEDHKENEKHKPEIEAGEPGAKCDQNIKDSSWESGDEWDTPETTVNKERTETEQIESEQSDINTGNIPPIQTEHINDEINLQPEEEKDETIENETIENEIIENETIENEIIENETIVKETTEILLVEQDSTEQPAEVSLDPETVETSEIDTLENTEKSETSSNDSILNIENKKDDKDGNESPKPDSATVEVNEQQTRVSSTPPLDTLSSIPLLEDTAQNTEKVTSSIIIAFPPGKKYQLASNKKERVLQLYDDSDWEEWESKNEVDKSKKPASTENDPTELDKMTEAISEEERSYTPCLDEREPVKGQFSDEERNVGIGIGGMDTELISDEERNDMFDESHDMKTISDGDALEINAKESELDMTRPEDYEEGEIIEKLGAKKNQDNEVEMSKQSGSEDEKNKKRPKKKEKELEKNKTKETDKQSKKPEFKKISKSNKDRNYRDKDKARSKSKEKKDKENKENRKEDKKKKERKRDLERYNVRSIIAEKPKKDQFGRDINKSPSRSSRSVSPVTRRSRSHSWNRNKRRRRRSRSLRRSRSRSGSRSRSRGKSLRRSRSFRRSKSPRRSRSKSLRRSRSPRSKRYRLDYRSTSRDRDRSRRYRDKSRRKSAERLRNKKKNRSLSRTRLRSRTPSLSKHRIRGEWGRSVDESRRQSYTREWTPSWSRSPTPPRPVPRHNLPQSMSPSWTPPLIEKGPVQPENLTVILTNNEMNKTKKKEKKKKVDKKSKDEYRKRKRGDRTPPPSKEVFASGDNILVSVSFNKTSEENVAPTREVTGVKRKRDENIKKKKDKIGDKKKKRAKSPRTKKKNKEVANMKPVAIIDLDRSPFKEITPSPKDIIVLSDSDNCEKEDETIGHHDMMQEELLSLGVQVQEDSAPQSPTANYLNTTGPKTPPEPQVKFLLTSKQTQLRQINNPLHDPTDENEVDIDPQEELEHRLDDVLHKGPNTPPEPPSSPPSSPDAYDPFDPTKSRSPTPEPATTNQPINSAMNTPGDKTESDGDLVDLAVGPLESSQKSTSSINDTSEKRSGSLDRTKRLSSSPERASQTLTPPVSSDQPMESSDSNKNDAGEKSAKSPERSNIGVVINQQVQPQFPAVVKPIISTPSVITSTPAASNATVPRTNLFNTPSSVAGTPRIPASVPQRIILPTPAKSSPAKMSPLKTSPSKPPIKSTPIKPMPSKTMISKLPVPNMKPITPVRKGPQTKITKKNVGQNGNEVIDVDLDFESPYSPGSSDYEDLFEPPTESTKNNSNSRAPTKNTTKSPAKQNVFDTLFGSSPVFRAQNNKSKSKTNAAKIPIKMNKKSTPTKAGTKTVGVKIDEDNLKILDDLPNSAVEMQVKDKFLKKLNRQERVVEEVKLVLKPHYNKKHVTKEQYKDILRRAVPKICHNRSGEINPKKIQNLIEAYVKKARHNKKVAAGGATTNTGATAQQSKPFLRKR